MSIRSLARRDVILAFCVGWTWFGPPAFALWDTGTDESSSPKLAPIEIRDGLMIAWLSRNRREMVSVDPVAAQVINGAWRMPQAGDRLTNAPDESRRWELTKAQTDGSFARTDRTGYLASTVTVADDVVMMLDAAGHAMVYVNREPRVGDIYGTGYVQIPVQLHKGPNAFLFQTSGRALKARLTAPKAHAFLNPGDLTAPDLIVNEQVATEAAVLVVNATARWCDSLVIETILGNGDPTREIIIPLAPLAVRKVPFKIKGAAPQAQGACPLQLKLKKKIGQVGDRLETLDTVSIALRVRESSQVHKRTFRSEIDGSVQYYAVVPALPVPANSAQARSGLVLTLHGAGVEAIGQAEAYARKPGLQIIAPTNRRPYGFDWEDWGRLDAMEVLDRTQRIFDADLRRTYLTGHSMGGHGTWHLGVTFPDRFAAIAPSAGWISMWSYAGARRAYTPGSVQELVASATAPSDTLALVRNLGQLGVYVLHGDQDDNVPVTEARRMREVLGSFHPDFSYHEQPGAGHWWGSACVDWPPLFTFLEQHLIPLSSDVRQIDFITSSPAISHRAHWVSIEAPIKWMSPSALHLEVDPKRRYFHGTTQNVARLALDVGHALPDIKNKEAIDVELDGQLMQQAALISSASVPGHQIRLVRSGTQWSVARAPALLSEKGPLRMGPFKEAFRNRFVLVVGTKGTPDENAVGLSRARFDAETFWYRGNGAVDIVRDTTLIDTAQAEAFRDRNVIVYGHAQSNAAWMPLLADSQVQVRRGEVRIGARAVSGDDLACVFVRPKPGSDFASVGVVAGSSSVGLNLTARLPYLTSGVAYPDCVLLSTHSLRDGPTALIAAGYFGPDWRVESGDFAWRN